MLVYDVEINLKRKDDEPYGFIGVLYDDEHYTFETAHEFIQFIKNKEVKMLVGYNNANYDNFIINKLYRAEYEKTEVTFVNINDEFFENVDDHFRYQPIWALKDYDHDLVDIMTILNPSSHKSLKEYALEMNYNYSNTLNTYDTWDDFVKYNLDDLKVTKLLYETKEGEIQTIMNIKEMNVVSFYLKSFLHPATQIRNFVKYNLAPNDNFNLNDLWEKILDEKVKSIFKKIYIEPVPTLTTAQARQQHGTKKKYEQMLSTDKQLTRGGIVVELGKGGIHDKKQWYKQDGRIVNIDFSSFYPHLYILMNVFKDGSKLRDMLKVRLSDKSSDQGKMYKLILNTLYGILQSIDTNKRRYDQGVTMVGQTIILELIDFVCTYDKDAEIIDVNTDGIMVRTDMDIPLNFVSPSFNYVIPYEITEVVGLYKKDTNNYYYQGKSKGEWLSSIRTGDKFLLNNIEDVIFKGELINPKTIVKYKLPDQQFKIIEYRYLSDRAIEEILNNIKKCDYINGIYATFIKKDLFYKMLNENMLLLSKPDKLTLLKELSDTIREDFFKRFK